jgi:hypothetical protein
MPLSFFLTYTLLGSFLRISTVGSQDVLSLYKLYRKRKGKDDRWRCCDPEFGSLAVFSVEFCELPGTARIGMIRAEGILEVFRPRPQRRPTFIAFPLGLEGAPEC